MRTTAWCFLAMIVGLVTVWNWDSLEPHIEAASKDDWTAFLILAAIVARLFWMAIDRLVIEAEATGTNGRPADHRALRRWLLVVFVFGAGLWICLR